MDQLFLQYASFLLITKIASSHWRTVRKLLLEKIKKKKIKRISNPTLLVYIWYTAVNKSAGSGMRVPGVESWLPWEIAV